jgi:murein DD-endopeptidase MepM/ murein hydrolase activator NlpD
MYLHLSSVAVRIGQHVSQGDVLGRVGSSGLSTGPHLDYRLRKNGAYVNPLIEHRRMPPGDPIPASMMAAFAVERDKAAALLPAPAAAAPPPAAPAGRPEKAPSGGR